MKARALLAAACVASGAVGCQDDLAPYGEVVLVVDTDLPVPRLASRLRVDVFAPDPSAGGDPGSADDPGLDRAAWISSRDFGLPSPSDWPASFGLFARDEAVPRDVLVRLRAYADGEVRDYLGERFRDRPAYAEPTYAHTLGELCASAPELELGRELTQRRGPDVVTEDEFSTDCPYVVASGAVAARVHITEAATYRFEVVRDDLNDSMLILRGDCAVPASEIACNEDASPTQLQPRLVVDLEPGDYSLVATATLGPSSADVTLRGARADLWDELPPEPSPEPPAPTPRLVRGGVDATPATEPRPRAAIDRLLRLRTEPGRVGYARVTLRGACAGTMARLSEGDPVEAASLATAASCVDVEAERVAPAPLALGDDASASGPSVAGSFVDPPGCPPPDDSPYVCLPAGAFLFGGPSASAYDLASLPERLAVVSRFFLDRNEVTVARMRAALGAGLVLPSPPATSSALQPFCPWTDEPGEDEERPMACLDWSSARAFCLFVGGDLPTEAQWEYAASAAGKPADSRYPEGDAPPGCGDAIFGRRPPYAFSCASEGLGPVDVAESAARDATPALGVASLAGNVSEWTRDGAAAFDAPCWDSRPLRDPECVDSSAPRHVVRGGSFFLDVAGTVATNRLPLPGVAPLEFVGLRCAYAERP